MDRGAQRAAVHGVTESDRPERTTWRRQHTFPGDPDSKKSAAVQETWVRSLGQEDPLEKRKATHPCILSWRIPWTEEPGRYILGITKSQTLLSANSFTYKSVVPNTK